MIFRLVVRALGGAVAAVLVAGFTPLGSGPIVAGYLLFVAALLVVELLAAVRAAVGGAGSSFEQALARRPGSPGRPEDLRRLEDQVSIATATSLDVYLRLRPPLREAAAQRLRVRHGVDLDADPTRARALLGDDTWELVRPDLQPPSDRFARGITAARLERVVDRLEQM